jgi:small redox-active disulfide protein 2
MKKVEILGPGCQKCRLVKDRVKEIIEDLQIEAEVEEVTDLDKIIELGVIATPAVVVDGRVKSAGRIPTREEIVKYLR